MKEKRWDASNVAGNTRTKMISQVICSHNRDGSLWRDAATSTFALKWEETLLNLSSPFLNRYLYCTLNVTEFKKKKKNQETIFKSAVCLCFQEIVCILLTGFFFLYLSSLNVYLAWIKPKVGEVYTALILNMWKWLFVLSCCLYLSNSQAKFCMPRSKHLRLLFLKI